MSTFLIAFFAFIVAIGILVTFHEFGHFLAARCLGVKVLRFSVGFGKPLWRKTDKKQTEYVIGALPLGGYVKMLDEREGPVAEHEREFAFNRKPVMSRITIVLAGPVFNFLFAIIAYWFMYMIGISGWVPKIGEILPDSIAAKAGMVAGQEIVSIDNQSTPTWQQVYRQLMGSIGDKGILEISTIGAEGQKKQFYLDLKSWELKGEKPDLVHGLGIEPYQPPIPPIIYDVMPEEPAAKAGIVINDEIVDVNGKPIEQWKQFTEVVAKSIDKPIKLTIKRDNQLKQMVLTPRAKENSEGEIVGFAGLVVKTTKMPDELMRQERFGPLAAFEASVEKTVEYTVISVKLIGKLIVGKIGLRTLSGPVSIAQGAGATVVIGFQYYLGFLAVISISLGVLNLLPIPILDGGHLLFFLIELITRKPVPERIQTYGFKIGLFLLIFLMTIAFYNDLVRLL